MKAHLRCWSTLAVGVFKESARRKDLYVVAILAALIIIGAGFVGFFGVTGIEVFAKDLAFGVISILSSLLCIMVASRQLPDEIRFRTLYPLLARPITRLDFLAGKCIGAFSVSALAFLVLIGVGCASLAAFHLSVGAILWQYVLLRLLALWMLTAIVLTFSLVLTPAANVTVCLLLTIGASTISRAMLIAHDGLAPSAKAATAFVYYLLPHLDLFDLGKKAAYGWPPIPAWVLGALAAYALAYSSAMILLGWLKFRRQPV